MRKRLRCDNIMIEEYMLKTQNLTALSSVVLGKGSGLFSKSKGKVKAAVCPNCGEISVYFDNLSKIKE